MTKKYTQRFVTLVNDALTRVEEVTPENVMEKLEGDDSFELIDVREKQEWEQAHIPGTDHLARGVIERDIEKHVRKMDREIVLYSSGGYRSVLAADNLLKMGYLDVKSMKGGFRAWTEAGLPIEKGND